MKERARLIEQYKLVKGTASQGLALAGDAYYGASAKSLFRFNTDWTLIEKKAIRYVSTACIYGWVT